MNNTLKAYRALINVTQQEMADIIGIGLTSYNQKEQGKKDFNHTEMAKAINYIKTKIPEVTVDDIFFSNEVTKIKNTTAI